MHVNDIFFLLGNILILIFSDTGGRVPCPSIIFHKGSAHDNRVIGCNTSRIDLLAHSCVYIVHTLLNICNLRCGFVAIYPYQGGLLYTGNLIR